MLLLLPSFFLFLLMFRQARDAVKAIKKRLGNKNPNTQLYAVMVSIMTLLWSCLFIMFHMIFQIILRIPTIYMKTVRSHNVFTVPETEKIGHVTFFSWIFTLLTVLYYGVLLTNISFVDFLVAGNVDEQHRKSYSWAGDRYRNYSYSCENCKEKGEFFSTQTIVILSFSNVNFPFSLSLSIWSFSLLAVRFTCEGANISPTRCSTNIPWWCFWKVSAVL